MTERATYKGVPVTDELEEQVAAETLAELAAMSDEEREAAKREPGALAKRMGRPRLGGGQSVLLRVRLGPELASRLDQAAAASGQHRSDIVRQALVQDLRQRLGPDPGEAALADEVANLKAYADD